MSDPRIDGTNLDNQYPPEAFYPRSEDDEPEITFAEACELAIYGQLA